MIEKVLMRLVLAIVLSGGLYIAYASYKKDMAELQNLREYKISVDNREAVSGAGRDSFKAQTAARDTQTAGNAAQRTLIESKTAEVARDDQATADFLALPIPERLRAADREARLQRGLGASQRAPGSAGTAH